MTVTVTETAEPPEPTPEEPEPASPSPSPTPESLSREAQAEMFATFINDEGSALADAIESDHRGDGVESVDQLTYDADTETLVVSLTTGWATDDYRRDAAWAVTRSLVGLVWSGEVDWLTDLDPSLQLQVDQLTYNCDGEFLAGLGARQASRDDWQASCAQ